MRAKGAVRRMGLGNSRLFEMRHIALITGASRGLGSAIALELAASGLSVAINYKNSHDLAERLCSRIRAMGGEAAPFQADVRDEAQVSELVNEVTGQLGPIDTLVVNATGPQPFLAIEEQTWECYLDQLEFFVKSPLLLLKAILPNMKRNSYGRVIPKDITLTFRSIFSGTIVNDLSFIR